jgi:hypothetical protein
MVPGLQVAQIDGNKWGSTFHFVLPFFESATDTNPSAADERANRRDIQ